MAPEVFVSAMLQASVTAAGLLIAIFGITIPNLQQLVSNRATLYEKHRKELIKLLSDSGKSGPKGFDSNKYLDKMAEIEKYKSPLPFTIRTIMLIFILYIITSILCVLWFFNIFVFSSESSLAAIGFGFVIATLMFVVLVSRTMVTIFQMLENVFDLEYKKLKEYAAKIRVESIKKRGDRHD